MEIMKISPYPICGKVCAPASKSYGHRLLICAALADRPTVIRGLGDCEDIKATIECLRSLGAKIEKSGSDRSVTPINVNKYPTEVRELFCGESGSTTRFLLPIAAALGGDYIFLGSGRLPERPMRPMTDLFSAHGVSADSDHLPMHISGKLSGDDFSIDGSLSSQFTSGLLFALSLLDGERTLRVSGQIQSKDYVEMTLDVLSKFGIQPGRCENAFIIENKAKSSQLSARSSVYDVEGDWSAAAFWLAAGAIGAGDISVSSLSLTSIQGDRAVLSALRGFGAIIKTNADGSISAKADGRLHKAVIECQNIPDLVPALAVVAAYADGESRFDGISRLRIKESDRVAAVISMLEAFGIAARADNDSLYVIGGHPHGGSVNSFGDHRIAMSAAICALAATGETVITNPECVGKSYENFWKDLSDLSGGKIRSLQR